MAPMVNLARDFWDWPVQAQLRACSISWTAPVLRLAESVMNDFSINAAIEDEPMSSIPRIGTNRQCVRPLSVRVFALIKGGHEFQLGLAAPRSDRLRKGRAARGVLRHSKTLNSRTRSVSNSSILK